MFAFKTKRTVKSGLKSLWLHKLRSGLTMLGITFGVSSVIAMLAIGEGAGRETQRQIERLGSHNIIIQSVQPPQEQTDSTRQRINEYGLTYGDAERIRDTVPRVEVTVPARRVRRRVWAGGQRLETEIVGTVPWYAGVTPTEVAEGRFLTSVDLHARAHVCVLGRRAARLLFPFGDALGSVIRVNNLRYRVVGIASAVARPETAGGKPESDPSSNVYIPLTTMRAQFGKTIMSRSTGSMTIERVELHEFIVKVDDLDSVLPTEKVIDVILKQGHKKQDYQVVVPLQLLEQARQTQRIFTIVLGSIAAISLLVGGIGIMNITLATVMERTREIGIRRAMGAKRLDIVVQFLIETVLLAMFGGGCGVLLGVLAPALVSHVTHMATVVTAWSLVLAFGISASVGVLFGIYPAYRAAHMDPIQALRHE